MNTLIHVLKKIIPSPIISMVSPLYHWSLAFLSAVYYGFPSRDLVVIAVTGTKGKTSTTELINAFFEEEGIQTALSNTIRFKIASNSERNMFKMSMPGRGYLQRFFKRAKEAGCTHVILEMTSQGVLQHRHRFISLDALVFTNLSPEHIESHGSYENYRDSKLKIAKLLSHSRKKRTVLIANGDDKEAERFLSVRAAEKKSFSLKHAGDYSLENDSIAFSLEGTSLSSHLSGEFNIYNILGAIFAARAFGIDLKTIKKALKKFTGIRGRLEKVEEGQDFTVIVDYAHTTDSLEKVYTTFDEPKICVLGNTGGGRDKWKRKEMAKIAESHCKKIILTNEDPYDEEPQAIIDDMARALTIPKYEIVMDRREAIHHALRSAAPGNVVLITGKGTDPFIMGANGMNTPWDDATVCREELHKILRKD